MIRIRNGIWTREFGIEPSQVNGRVSPKLKLATCSDLAQSFRRWNWTELGQTSYRLSGPFSLWHCPEATRDLAGRPILRWAVAALSGPYKPEPMRQRDHPWPLLAVAYWCERLILSEPIITKRKVTAKTAALFFSSWSSFLFKLTMDYASVHQWNSAPIIKSAMGGLKKMASYACPRLRHVFLPSYASRRQALEKVLARDSPDPERGPVSAFLYLQCAKNYYRRHSQPCYRIAKPKFLHSYTFHQPGAATIISAAWRCYEVWCARSVH